MTVTYSLEVSRARLFGFAKLLLRWRGSIYRLMYGEMLVFVVLFYAIAFTYRVCLNAAQRGLFEQLSVYCREFTELIPITFVLGFYVTFVMGRWWQMYMAIPWPDKTALQVGAYIQGTDEVGRMTRRTLVRYLNLISVLTFRSVSTVVKKRFPTEEHIVEAGLMTTDEHAALVECTTPHGNWWVPSVWYCQLVMAARHEGRILDDLHLKSLIDVVTVGVYIFFIACLLGRQYLYTEEPAGGIDKYVPVYTLFQFFFYMGWLKVAEEMICPYGEDDDDFEMNWVLDRNVQMSYVCADALHRKHPRLTRDAFWNELEPEIPYTAAAEAHRSEPFMGSAYDMDIAPKGMEWMEPIEEEAEEGTLPKSPPDDKQALIEDGCLHPNSTQLNSNGVNTARNDTVHPSNECSPTPSRRALAKPLSALRDRLLRMGQSRLSLAERGPHHRLSRASTVSINSIVSSRVGLAPRNNVAARSRKRRGIMSRRMPEPADRAEVERSNEQDEGSARANVAWKMPPSASYHRQMSEPVKHDIARTRHMLNCHPSKPPSLGAQRLGGAFSNCSPPGSRHGLLQMSDSVNVDAHAPQPDQRGRATTSHPVSISRLVSHASRRPSELGCSAHWVNVPDDFDSAIAMPLSRMQSQLSHTPHTHSNIFGFDPTMLASLEDFNTIRSPLGRQPPQMQQLHPSGSVKQRQASGGSSGRADAEGRWSPTHHELAGSPGNGSASSGGPPTTSTGCDPAFPAAMRNTCHVHHALEGVPEEAASYTADDDQSCSRQLSKDASVTQGSRHASRQISTCEQCNDNSTGPGHINSATGETHSSSSMFAATSRDMGFDENQASATALLRLSEEPDDVN